MRYMGDATTPGPFPSSLTPEARAQLIAMAKSMPDAQASDLLDLSDATGVGQRSKILRIGVGVGVGLVVGYGLSKILGG